MLTALLLLVLLYSTFFQGDFCFCFKQKLREELRTLNGDEAEAIESSDDESGPVAFRNRLARSLLFPLFLSGVNKCLSV